MIALLPCDPELLACQLDGADRLLLFGDSGLGKSTLAAALARVFSRTGRACLCLGADPGSPSFGVPGAVCLGRWEGDGWQLVALEALCTLDAGRFRLPLVSAVRRLARGHVDSVLLVDGPGLVRGVAGAEMVPGLVEAAAVDTVLVLAREADKLPLENELRTTGCRVLPVRASGSAQRPGQQQRARQRTRLWNAYLAQAGIVKLPVAEELLVGTPPPLEFPGAWCGRQLGLLRGGRTLALGEILEVKNRIFRVRMAVVQEIPDQLLVRDAFRNEQGNLAAHRRADRLAWHPVPSDVALFPGPETKVAPCPVVRLGDATGVLVNGVFGDPLLHLRLQYRKRSFLFDLGEGSRLPARLAHQVTEVLISHAHIDHIAGFVWLLRSRIGLVNSCRLFGPPGLADRIAGLLNGIHWDRIGGEGPRFEVSELHSGQLRVYNLQAGRQKNQRPAGRPAPGGLLLAGPDCTVRAVTLDHAGIPVLAYALELAPKLNVLKERLAERRLAPGPWLGELKRRLAAGDRQAVLALPDGTAHPVASLAADVLRVTPARKLVYATDLSDTRENRHKLIGLAREAEALFCEAAFLAADRTYAEQSGHLTAPACGEIAQAAEVKKLFPFHLSRRYEKRPLEVYAEVKVAYGGELGAGSCCFATDGGEA